MPETDFLEQMLSRVGGLAKMTTELEVYPEMIGKIGLLMDVYRVDGAGSVVLAEVLVDGSVKEIYVIPGDLEFIGADDVS
jgi:hypothetical protein